MSADRIVIEGLEVWGHHGVLPHERELGQRFVVDVTLEVDLAAAGASDDLADTVDYGAVAQAVHDLVAEERHDLLERVAERIAERALADDRVTGVEVTLHKPSAPLPVPAREVRVEVRRTR